MPGLTGLTQTAVAALFNTSEATDLEAKWHQPLAEPVRHKVAPQLAVALIASGLAFVAAAPFAERVTEDRWHQPWSEPVRTRWFPPAEQQAAAPDPLPRVSFSWWVWLSEPVVKAKPRLAEAHQQYLAFAPPFSAGAVQSEWAGPPPSLVRFQYQAQARPPWPDINLAWLPPLSEPVRVKPALPAPEQQFYGFDEDIIFVDRWFSWWSEPVRVTPALSAASQQVLAFDPLPLPFLGGGGGWYLPDPTKPPAPGHFVPGVTPGKPAVARRAKAGAPRQVAPKIEPPTFAEVLGAQQPARLVDVLGSAFVPRLDELRPPALDLYVPPAVALRTSEGKPAPGAHDRIDAIADHVDALDAAEALHALDELDRQEKEILIAAVLQVANSE